MKMTDTQPPTPIFLPNLFTPEELAAINHALDTLPDRDVYAYRELGRVHLENGMLPPEIELKLNKLIKELFPDLELEVMNPPLCVEYSNKYGVPKLRPHYDGDFTDYIIDFQLSSSPNTSWPLGIDMNLYTLEDNSAVLFHPNRNVHWRPRKTFKDDEYIRVMFFRFIQHPHSDFFHLSQLDPSSPIFDEVNAFRDSLGTL